MRDPRPVPWRAPHACDPRYSRGRLYPESESPTRTAFQRDRDRIIHSTAFRRLMHKTQVFVYHEGDHYRTRLTHSLEVAQIARSMSRSLGLDEDLAEAIGLAHDLGHTPFGHAGEDALAASMAPYGGFDHNAQTLRVLTKLEARYADFEGLNLTWESLEGLVKHNGPLTGGADEQPVPTAIADYVERHNLELGNFAGAEAQIAALSDDIAYNNHDIDDGLRAHLFTIDDLAEVPPVGTVLAKVGQDHPGLEPSKLVHELVRGLIDLMVRDALDETRRRLDEARPPDAGAIRQLTGPVVAFSDEMRADETVLKAFLGTHIYRHPRVERMAAGARRIVTDLFAMFFGDPTELPPEWRKKVDRANEVETARVVADYIAGMTDRYALAQHSRHFQSTPELS